MLQTKTSKKKQEEWLLSDCIVAWISFGYGIFWYVIKGMFIIMWIVIINKFNINNSINEYQSKYSNFYRCPYSSKSGSCSEEFRKRGLKSLITKCKYHKIQEG